jgi:hypothetical protein
MPRLACPHCSQPLAASRHSACPHCGRPAPRVRPLAVGVAVLILAPIALAGGTALGLWWSARVVARGEADATEIHRIQLDGPPRKTPAR